MTPKFIYSSSSQALLAHDWYELDRMFRHRETKLTLNKQDRLRWALARLHLGQSLEAVQDDLPAHVSDERTRSLLIRHGVIPLREAGVYKVASALMERIISPESDLIGDGLKRVSLLIQSGQSERALEVIESMHDIAPSNSEVAQVLLRLLVKTRRRNRALALARENLNQSYNLSWARLLLPLMSMSPLESERHWSLSIVNGLTAQDPAWLELMMQVYANLGQHKKVLEIGEKAKVTGLNSMKIHRLIAQAIDVDAPTAQTRQKSLEHWRAAFELDPNNSVVATSLADVLLRLGRYKEALPILERQVQFDTSRPYVYSLYARALRQGGNYDGAVKQYRLLQKMQPESMKWPRYLASSLLLAGHREEATNIFTTDLEKRRSRLSDNFEHGLRALHTKVDDIRLPQARIDWAWSLKGLQNNINRSEWTRRAVWGHLADHYLLDWLECRPELAEQAMHRLSNLESVDVFLKTENPDGLPWILVSAHVGPMYAGPMALALLDLKVRWLASTPGLLKGDYSDALISTTGLTESEVVRKSLMSLQQGYSLVIAVDGAINLAAPTVTFEGQHITYSPFAARLAHRMNLPSAFVAPMWDDGQINFFIERLPQPSVSEPLNDFIGKWRVEFLKCLARYLQGAPENLRLSGGLWRQIR